MALLFIDSFDHYATADLTEKWTTNLSVAGNVVTSIAAGSGRRSSNSFRMAISASATQSTAAGLQKVLAPADATAVAGVSCLISSAAVLGTLGAALASVRDGATAQISLRLNPNLTLSVLRGAVNGTVLGTTTAALSAGVSAYLEWKTLIHPSAGTVDLRINGASVLSLTAQNTRNTANSSWTAIALGTLDAAANIWAGTAATGTLDFDDLYILDGTGAAPLNGFLGDCRVDARYPTAAGATTGWTASTGANWAAVDDPAPNDDTDYTAAATTGLTDTFVVQDAPVAGAAIYGVQHCLSAKKTDAGTASIAPVVRHSGVDYVGGNLNPGTAYAVLLAIAATNPGTSAAWTEAGFNAAEFGYKRTA